MDPLGRHLLAELWECGAAINDAPSVERAMREAVARSGATLLHLQVHAFQPQGITALAMLSESHLSLHTWPERGYAAADLFTCGDHVRPRLALEHLAEAMSAGSLEIVEVPRGSRSPVAVGSHGGPS